MKRSKVEQSMKEDPSHKFLDDVDGSSVFYVRNGPVIRNIYELLDGFDHMSQDSFDFHVTPEKNDFSNWIAHVLGDKQLAENIRHKSRQDAGSMLRKRILELEDEIEKSKIAKVIQLGNDSAAHSAKEEKEPEHIEVKHSHNAMNAEKEPENESRQQESAQERKEREHKEHQAEHHEEKHEHRHHAKEKEEKPKHSGFFAKELASIKSGIRNNIELFLLGLVVGILIGKFVLGGF